MHAISLICTDATTPETVAATTTLKIDDKEIQGVRSFKLKWEHNTLPVVILEFEPGELVVNTGADTTLTIQRGQFVSDQMSVRSL